MRGYLMGNLSQLRTQQFERRWRTQKVNEIFSGSVRPSLFASMTPEGFRKILEKLNPRSYNGRTVRPKNSWFPVEDKSEPKES